MIDEDDWQTKLENEPAFIAMQLQAGHTLSESDVAAIQAAYAEWEHREYTDTELFHQGRTAAFHEIGGQRLVDAVEAKHSNWIEDQVRKVLDKMDQARGVPTERDRLRMALQEIAGMGSRYAKAVRTAQHALALEVGT